MKSATLAGRIRLLEFPRFADGRDRWQDLTLERTTFKDTRANPPIVAKTAWSVRVW